MMSKNLGKHKQELQTRECLVQAIYQYIFHESNLNSLIDQFLKENTPKKISFNYFKERLEKAGFEAEMVNYTENFSEEIKLKYGLQINDVIPIARKSFSD